MTSLGARSAQWLSRLVQIPSVTPIQAGPTAGVAGEARIAGQLAKWFTELGGAVHIDEVKPNRPSVYGIWRGRTRRWAGVDVHTDTVGVEQMISDPFSGEIRDGRVWGRGAVDTKATLGVILALLETMVERGLEPETTILVGATIDEEFGASGAPAFAQWMRREGITLDQLAVAEPTNCVPIYGHKGVARFELTVEGRAAHSSQPDLGQNAIVAAAHIVLAYQERHQQLQREHRSGPLGVPALTVSLIQGGTGINVVPDLCRVSVDRRVVDGERPATVIDALYDQAVRICPLPISLCRLREMDAFLQSPDLPWISEMAKWTGSQPQVAPYGTNAWAYVDLPGECIVIGPGSIDQAHGSEEWVEISELEKLSAIYAKWWGVDL